MPRGRGVKRRCEPGAEAQQPRYRGVLKNRRKWTAQISHGGRLQYLGVFADGAEAARAYDARARVLHGARARLNFPEDGERQGEAQRMRSAAELAAAAADGARESRHRGVRWDARGRKWTAQIMHEGRRQHLGCFAHEDEAARAYDDEARKLRGARAELNFPEPGERQGVAQRRRSAAEPAAVAEDGARGPRHVGVGGAQNERPRGVVAPTAVGANSGDAWPSVHGAEIMALLDDDQLSGADGSGDDVWGGADERSGEGWAAAYDGQRPPGAVGAAAAAAAQQAALAQCLGEDVSVAAASLPAGGGDGVVFSAEAARYAMV